MNSYTADPSLSSLLEALSIKEKQQLLQQLQQQLNFNTSSASTSKYTTSPSSPPPPYSQSSSSSSSSFSSSSSSRGTLSDISSTPHFQLLTDKFKKTWAKVHLQPTIKKIWKIQNHPIESHYKAYKASHAPHSAAAAQAQASATRYAPEVFLPDTLFCHGSSASSTCKRTGLDKICEGKDCANCNISLHSGFLKSKFRSTGRTFARFGHGHYVTTYSSKAHDYNENSRHDLFDSYLIIICQVVTGKPFGFRTTSQNLTNPPEGFHSVYGVGGTDSVLNFDELVLYNDHAILPLYVVRYTTTPVDICASVIYFKSPSRSSVVTCDCCSKDIEFSNAYMHCYTCGNFDLCESCYFHGPQYSKTSSHHFNSSVQASKASHSHSLTPVAPFDNLTIEKVPLKTVIQTKLVRPPPVEVQVGYYVVAGLLIPRTVQMQPEPKLCLVTTTVGFTCSKCQDEIPEEECFLNCKTCETIHCRSCARYNSHSHKMTLCVGYEA